MMRSLEFLGILSGNDPPKSPESLPGQGQIDVHGEIKKSGPIFGFLTESVATLSFPLGKLKVAKRWKIWKST